MSLEAVLAAIEAAPVEPETEWERAALAECDPSEPGIPGEVVTALLAERARNQPDEPAEVDPRARILAAIAAAPVEEETEWERAALAEVNPHARVPREHVLEAIVSSAEAAAAE